MRKEVVNLKSKHLGKDVNIGVFGHFGISIILFPSVGDSYLENENEGLIDSISTYIKNGRVKVFSIDSVNSESWFGNDDISPEEKSKRHYEYNNFLLDELIPYVYSSYGGPAPVITAGCAKGAFHALNTYLRRPDIFIGAIAIDGVYDIEKISNGYFDENCYFNSPMHYLPNLTDNYWLTALRSRHHVYIAAGSGRDEQPQYTTSIGEIMSAKNIPHIVDIWGSEWNYDWNSWRTMFKHFVESKL